MSFPRPIHEAIARLRQFFERPQDFIENDTVEITSYHTLTARIQSLADILGLEQLGSGNFSRVFALSDRVVLKVACKNDDDAYEMWAKYCSDHPNNPYLPRVYYRGRYGSKCFYILERLEPNDYYDDEREWFSSVDTLRKFCLRGEIEIKCPHKRSIIMEMSEHFNDCGGDNIMQRINPDGTRQLVITDPCS